MAITPPSLNRFCREDLARILKATSGRRLMQDVEAVWETDRWNSFDRFHDTTNTLVRHYESVGAQAEVDPIQTGGWIDSGRWIIDQAHDVAAATVDIVKPVRQRLLDYQDNPWHVVGWTSATPKAGMRTGLVVYDSKADLERLPRGALVGKTVLTKLSPRDLVHVLGDKGAAGVISDQPVPELPDALQWIRFGWGEAPMFSHNTRMVGLVISENQGRRLRRLLQKHGSLSLHTRVHTREYVGTHDVVSGIVRGAGDPQDEVWAIAHSAEPGAVDNASGVALCMEIAQVLESLIASGALPRPKRSIRLVNAYECYGFFAFLERMEPLQTPLAGVCLDTLGSKPELNDGRLEWHSTIPMSAGFVDWVGEKILRETLKRCNPGYRLCLEPFMPTSDTLIGDPEYGFPCPWLDSHHRASGKGYAAYHTSGDVPRLLSRDGLRACSAAMAGYLYYLADAGSREVVELATAETERKLRALAGRKGSVPASQVEYLRQTHRATIARLPRWMWKGDRKQMLARLADCERQVREAGDHVARHDRVSHRVPAAARRVPRRTAFLSPRTINTRVGPSALTTWSLFWADGQRNLAEIAQLASWEETGSIGGGSRKECASITHSQVMAYFEAHRDRNYVELIEPGEMIPKSRLVADLKKLGLRPGMDVLVHSDPNAIGHVKGGAGCVVEALLTSIGKRGTLLMPSYNRRAAQVYHAKVTPTTEGAVADALWRRPDATRSDHPTHAVAAIGAGAENYCRDHRATGAWAEDSPIGRLIHGGGYILTLGLPPSASLAHHVAEMSVPCGCIDLFGRVDRVIDAQGLLQEVASLASRSAACPVPEDKLDATIERRRLSRSGKVGHAESTLVKAKDLWRLRRQSVRKACSMCTVKPESRG
ncbi:MAG: AAC(3) family N-acetyltransferase [Candidatus Latescibacterota bacterium]|nr:AAC(3) family N-acetyltransferase [Candidatus Latescibacterota bacterium]